MAVALPRVSNTYRIDDAAVFIKSEPAVITHVLLLAVGATLLSLWAKSWVDISEERCDIVIAIADEGIFAHSGAPSRESRYCVSSRGLLRGGRTDRRVYMLKQSVRMLAWGVGLAPSRLAMPRVGCPLDHIGLFRLCSRAVTDNLIGPSHLALGLPGRRRQRGRLGTPSMTRAWSPGARASSIRWIASIASSSCSSLIDLTPCECSTFSSRGTKSARILRYTPGWLRATVSIAFLP